MHLATSLSIGINLNVYTQALRFLSIKHNAIKTNYAIQILDKQYYLYCSKLL